MAFIYFCSLIIPFSFRLLIILAFTSPKLGLKVDPVRTSYNSIYFSDNKDWNEDPYFNGEGPKRKGCIHCGECMVGCRHDAKNTLDKNYLYLAEKYVDENGRRLLVLADIHTMDPPETLRFAVSSTDKRLLHHLNEFILEQQTE